MVSGNSLSKLGEVGIDRVQVAVDLMAAIIPNDERVAVEVDPKRSQDHRPLVVGNRQGHD
jgi:hypothetical protein